MKRITSAENLHPMKVTPMSFTRGDVVKKIYSDSITTPYTGVVTAVIPATNKVEVQWPQGMGLEDPWDLIKVNPIINPPTVREDKTYKTYQNQKAQKYNQDYSKDLCHHNVLNDFVSEHVMPVFMMSANLYNEGFSKREAFEKLNSESDNKHIVMYALDKVYTDRVAQEHYTVFNDEGNAKEASLVFSGNSDDGFNITYKYGSSSESYSSDNYQDSFETYNKFLNVLASLENTSSYEDVVSKVARTMRASAKDFVWVKLAHISDSARKALPYMKILFDAKIPSEISDMVDIIIKGEDYSKFDKANKLYLLEKLVKEYGDTSIDNKSEISYEKPKGRSTYEKNDYLAIWDFQKWKADIQLWKKVNINSISNQRSAGIKVGSAKEHIDNMKLSDLDIMLDKLHKSLQEE